VVAELSELVNLGIEGLPFWIVCSSGISRDWSVAGNLVSMDGSASLLYLALSLGGTLSCFRTYNGSRKSVDALMRGSRDRTSNAAADLLCSRASVKVAVCWLWPTLQGSRTVPPGDDSSANDGLGPCFD
jgi:hypothetical protein